MSSKSQAVERRKHERFQVPMGAFVGVGPGFAKVGPLLDISLGGLSFRYIDSAERPNGSYLEIFLSDRSLSMSYVPFKTVSDVEIADTEFFNSLPMRRCGVQFGELTHTQISELMYFIENQTTGETRLTNSLA